MDNTIWQLIGNAVLFVVTILMFLFFLRPASDNQKALLLGAGVFLVAIPFNLIGFTEISDYFAVFGFIILTLSLVRLFWVESKE